MSVATVVTVYLFGVVMCGVFAAFMAALADRSPLWFGLLGAATLYLGVVIAALMRPPSASGAKSRRRSAGTPV